MSENTSTQLSESQEEKKFPPAIAPERKFTLVRDWLAFGNLRIACERNNINYDTAKVWRTKPWWKEFEEEIQSQQDIATQNKITNIVDKGLDVMAERLEHGEFVYNSKTGEIQRKPVSLKDAANATNGLMQRHAILQKLNDGKANREQNKSIQEQLADIARTMSSWNKKQTKNVEEITFKETYADQGSMG